MSSKPDDDDRRFPIASSGLEMQSRWQQAGFVVAEVTVDKVQGSYRQVTSTTAVKQDLVISAYKTEWWVRGSLQSNWRDGRIGVGLRADALEAATSGESHVWLPAGASEHRRTRSTSHLRSYGVLVYPPRRNGAISTPEFLAELPVPLPRDGWHGVPA